MSSLLERLKERKLFQWALAYLAAAFVVFQSVEVIAEPWGIGPGLQRAIHILLLIGLFVVLIIAWYHGEQGRQRVSGPELLMIAVLLMVAAGVISLLSPEGREVRQAVDEVPTVAVSDDRPSIAALPWANRSGREEDLYFTDGIHDEILTRLSKLSGLRVISRQSVMRFRDSPGTMGEIAEALRVRYVLEAGLLRAQDNVRINVQLIDAQTDDHLWAETYDRPLSIENLLDIQTDIATQIAAELEAVLTPEERERVAARPTDNLEAYDLYLLGLYNFNAWTEETLDKAVDYFERAVELDPTMARAHAALAVAYSHEWLHAWGSLPGERHAKARREARTALALDSTLAEAHAALGYELLVSADWEGADAAFRRAIELSPSYAIAHAWLAELLAAQGRHGEARQTIERALALEPLSVYMNVDKGWLLYAARDYDRAAAELGRALELFPNAPELHAVLGAVYAQQGRLPEGIAELEESMRLSPTGSWFRGYLGYAYGRAGREADARRVLADLRDLSARHYVDPEYFALVHVGLGELDEAVDWLYRSQEDQSGWAMWIPVDPITDPLRSDPRYLALLDSVGLSGLVQ